LENTILYSNKGSYARIATNILFFLNGLSFASWASRIPDVKDILKLGDAALGAVLFAMPIGSLSALPVAGIIISRFGSKKITLFSMLFYFVSMPLLGYATSTFQLAIALFLFGFGSDMLNISMNVQAVNVEKIQQRSIMSSFHAVFSIGFMIGAALGGFIASENISVFKHLTFLGTTDLLIGILIYRFLVQSDQQTDKAQPLFALPDRGLVLLGIIAFCGMLSEGAMADWSTLYYKQVLHTSKGFATAGFTAFSIMMVVGRIFGDKIVNKFGLRKTLLINCLIVFLGMFVALIIVKPISVVIGFGITGLGLSTIVPLIYSEAGHSKTMSAGVALAAITTVGMGGFLLGPVLIGFLSEFSSLRIALSSLIILGLLGAFLTTKIK
jgi:MFS family permease